MKIICESEEEYKELMAASRYIHNLRCIDVNKNDIVYMIAHLYGDVKDFPLKNEIVILKKKEK